jgi:hypothetical protein
MIPKLSGLCRILGMCSWFFLKISMSFGHLGYELTNGGA